MMIRLSEVGQRTAHLLHRTQSASQCEEIGQSSKTQSKAQEIENMATSSLVNQAEEEEKQENKPSPTLTVAVTGASGFIAAHCIKQLLEKGYNVRGTVRGDPSSDRYKWLYDQTEQFNLPSKVTLFQADLLKHGTFTECFKDCDYIFHTASPFLNDVKDGMKDLVEPAKNGTLNVLSCAMEANATNNSLKRIVVTSSIAAINGKPDPKKVLYTPFDLQNATVCSCIQRRIGTLIALWRSPLIM